MLPPLVLLGLAAGALVYGAGLRSLPVVAEVKVEKETVILEAPPKDLFGPPGPGGRRPNIPLPPPRPKKVKVTETQEQVRDAGELSITRDVTVGGITRLPDGRLRLTYRAGEEGPALCPT
jgi:hypothetical protein